MAPVNIPEPEKSVIFLDSIYPFKIDLLHITSRRPNNETAAMLVFQINPVGVELCYHENAFFSFCFLLLLLLLFKNICIYTGHVC